MRRDARAVVSDNARGSATVHARFKPSVEVGVEGVSREHGYSVAPLASAVLLAGTGGSMGSPALAGALVAAVVLAGAGLWAGISISCEEKYEDEVRLVIIQRLQDVNYI